MPLSTVLDNTSALISQVDPDKFAVILDELDTALGGGPDALKSVIDGVSLTMAGLDSLLPQTTSLITNLRIIAATTSQIQPDLQTLTNSSGVLFDQFAAADAEVRRFLDLGPGQLATLGGVVNDTADPITNLLTNFVAIAESARLRTSALAALFPSLRDGSVAIGVPAWDNEFHTLVDILPAPGLRLRHHPGVPRPRRRRHHTAVELLHHRRPEPADPRLRQRPAPRRPQQRRHHPTRRRPQPALHPPPAARDGCGSTPHSFRRPARAATCAACAERVPRQRDSTAATASPSDPVVPTPPRSGVSTARSSASVASTALRIAAAASASPRWSSISEPLQI